MMETHEKARNSKSECSSDTATVRARYQAGVSISVFLIMSTSAAPMLCFSKESEKAASTAGERGGGMRREGKKGKGRGLEGKARTLKLEEGRCQRGEGGG
jgi:hypothetical protein